MKKNGKHIGRLRRLGVVVLIILICLVCGHLSARASWATSADPTLACDDKTGVCEMVERTFANYGQGTPLAELIAREVVGVLMFVLLLFALFHVIKGVIEAGGSVISYVWNGPKDEPVHAAAPDTDINAATY